MLNFCVSIPEEAHPFADPRRLNITRENRFGAWAVVRWKYPKKKPSKHV